MSRVFKLTMRAVCNRLEWDEAIATGEIETVRAFKTLEEALEYFNEELGGNSDVYGVE